MRGLEQVSGVPAPRWHVPHPVAVSVAFLSETWAKLTKGSTVMTVEGVRTMHAKLQVDSRKARRELDASFRPLEETLRDSVAWVREHGARAEGVKGEAPAATPA